LCLEDSCYPTIAGEKKKEEEDEERRKGEK
jgi:hypothetical protein